MLGNKDAIATVAVKDIKAALRFYEDKLGLTPAQDESHGVTSIGSAVSSSPGSRTRTATSTT